MKKVKYKDSERQFEMSNSIFEKMIDKGETHILFGKEKKEKWYRRIFQIIPLVVWIKIKTFFDF